MNNFDLVKFNGIDIDKVKVNGVVAWEKQNKVIKGYILDYIESTGTQWIDTGINFEIDDIFETTWEITRFYAYAVFGVRSETTSLSLIQQINFNTAASFFMFNTSSWDNSTFIFEVGAKYHTVFSKDELLVNNEQKSFNEPSSTVTDDGRGTIILFGRRNKITLVERLFYGKISQFNIQNNNTEKLNFIPYQTLDGTICMYDTVTNTTFENQGTGDFIGGEIIGYITEDNIAYNNDGTLYNPDITTAVMSMGVEPAETQTLQLAQLEELGVTI